MKKKLMIVLVCIFALYLAVSYAGEAGKRKLILRQAQEVGKTSVAVEAYLAGDVLEVTAYARMYGTRPKIYNLILVGPKLGRLSAQAKRTVYPKSEETEADLTFPTTKMDSGIISFSKKTKDKKSEGALTRELYGFKIPVDKIVPGKRYELRILIEGMQNTGQKVSFKFEFKDLAGELSLTSFPD